MPRHFSKIMNSPYFQSEHYANSAAGKFEKKIESFFNFKYIYIRIKQHYMLKKFKKIRSKDCSEFDSFDKKYNLKTSHLFFESGTGGAKFTPGIEHNNDIYPLSNGYQVCPLKYMDKICDELSKINNIQNYQFVDIGSGKGKIIFYNLLKCRPFSSYIGVEIDESLHNDAKENLLNTNIDINKEVEFINQDALLYNPEIRESVYFLFRPFSPEIHKYFFIKNKKIFQGSPTIIVLMCPLPETEMSIINDLNFTVYKRDMAFCIFKNNI